MLPVGNVDAHRTRQTYQALCSGVRHNGDGQLAVPAGNEAAVLQHKRSLPAPEGTCDVLHRHVAGRSLDAGAVGEHLPLARSLKVAVKRFVEAKPTEYSVLVRGLWCELYLERTSGSHVGFLSWDVTDGHTHSPPQ